MAAQRGVFVEIGLTLDLSKTRANLCVSYEAPLTDLTLQEEEV